MRHIMARDLWLAFPLRACKTLFPQAKLSSASRRENEILWWRYGAERETIFQRAQQRVQLYHQSAPILRLPRGSDC